MSPDSLTHLAAPEPETTVGQPTESRPPVGWRDGRLLLGVLVVGVLVDLWWQTPASGVAAVAAVAATVGCLVAGPVRSATGRLLLVAALVPACFLALRSSPWVVLVDLGAVAVLLALGASFSRTGNAFDVRLGQLGRALLQTAGTMLRTPPPPLTALARVRRPEPDAERRAAVLRGAALAVPVVIVLVLLLASGDAVFASLLHVSVDPWWPLPHLLAVLAGSWLAAGLLAQGERAALPGPRRPSLRLGATEGVVVLGALIVVYALFAVARLLVALRGADYVLETTGLTYAEYARSGFFQLLWAAGITLVVLLGLRAVVVVERRPARVAVAVLSLVAVALTLVMVHSAVARLALYDDAFGLTMLRLSCTVFAWWVAAVFVLVGLALAGVARGRSWLPGALLASAVLAAVAFSAIDPEAVVAERNLDRGGEQAPVDVAYLLSLSDDAVPTIVEGLAELEPADRSEVLAHLCRDDANPSWVRSERRAADARDEACRGV